MGAEIHSCGEENGFYEAWRAVDSCSSLPQKPVSPCDEEFPECEEQSEDSGLELFLSHWCKGEAGVAAEVLSGDELERMRVIPMRKASWRRATPTRMFSQVRRVSRVMVKRCSTTRWPTARREDQGGRGGMLSRTGEGLCRSRGSRRRSKGTSTRSRTFLLRIGVNSVSGHGL